jgi:hypothetical protein
MRGAVSIHVHITTVRKPAVGAADNGLLGAAELAPRKPCREVGRTFVRAGKKYAATRGYRLSLYSLIFR